jgi:phosphatidylinositol alpha-1,6-mannosyltransferase
MADALLVSSSFLPGKGGIESYLGQLCARLSPRVAVLAPGRRDRSLIPDDLGYSTYGFSRSPLLPTPGALRRIIEVAAQEDTRRVLFGTPWPLVLLAPALRARGLSYSVIVHGAETIVPGATPLLRRRLAAALGAADALFSVSGFTADRVSALLASTGRAQPPTALLRARVDTERFTPDADGTTARVRLGLSESDRVVLCFGRLVRRKGIHRIIRAYPALARQAERVVIVVAGSGPQQARLSRLADRTGARVVFAGSVSDEDAPALFACADVFALPVADRWMGLEPEGLGVVLLEAAACGVPCVAGRSGGTPEAVLDGRTGRVVDARDRGELTNATAGLLNDRSGAARMGLEGRRHVCENFAGSRLPALLLDWLA